MILENGFKGSLSDTSLWYHLQEDLDCNQIISIYFFLANTEHPPRASKCEAGGRQRQIHVATPDGRKSASGFAHVSCAPVKQKTAFMCLVGGGAQGVENEFGYLGVMGCGPVRVCQLVLR